MGLGTIFDIAEFDLPYNGILGRPALAQFMAVSHYAYLTVKMPGPSGRITVPADLKSAVACAEKLFSAAAAATDKVGERPECSGPPPTKTKLTTDDSVSVKVVTLSDDAAKTVKIGGHLAAK